jgi:hypothetical protein
MNKEATKVKNFLMGFDLRFSLCESLIRLYNIHIFLFLNNLELSGPFNEYIIIAPNVEK